MIQHVDQANTTCCIQQCWIMLVQHGKTTGNEICFIFVTTKIYELMSACSDTTKFLRNGDVLFLLIVNSSGCILKSIKPMGSHGNVRMINDDAHFKSEFEKRGSSLVVIDFTASWCGPCQRIAPVFAELSIKFAAVIFLKVDVDACQMTAASHGVRAMPTFQFFLNGIKVDELKGADATNLEKKVKEWSIHSTLAPVDSEKVAAGRQLDCFRELLENPPDTFNSACQLLLRIANNIIKDPQEPKYRTLKLSTNTFQSKLLPVKGAVECLFAMGFQDNENQIILQDNKPLEDLKMIRDTLLDEQNKREVLLKTMQTT